MPTEHISAKEFRITQGLSVKDVAEVKPKGVMNKWEQEYANLLSACLMAGIIDTFDYEPYSFIMSAKPKCSYLPDFLVSTNEGDKIVIEVKGFRREKDKIRFLWAAKDNPEIRFIMVTKKDGAWVAMYDINKEAARLPLELL